MMKPQLRSGARIITHTQTIAQTHAIGGERIIYLHTNAQAPRTAWIDRLYRPIYRTVSSAFYANARVRELC